MPLEYANITNTVQEKGNMGGCWQEVYFAPWDDFATFAERPSEDGPRNAATWNLLSVGQDTLKPGKRLYKMYNTAEKVELAAAGQGEPDGVSRKITLKLFNPGLTSEALFFTAIPNQNWVFYVREGNKMFRVGGPAFAAKLAGEGDITSGAKTADLKGVALTFWTYDLSYAPQVVDLNAILALVGAVDTSLTVVYSPAHGESGVLVDKSPTITYSEAVWNADTLASFTNAQASAIVTLNELDIDGNIVASKPFAGSISGNVITINPTTDFNANTIYELKVNPTKVISAAESKGVNGISRVRFTTA